MSHFHKSFKGISGLLLCLWIAAAVVPDAADARDRNREAKQAKLDKACEDAREARLAPLRAQFVEECVREKHRSSRKECEDFYADYGAQSGNRAPLFYDLPECVEAFEYQKSERER